MKKKLYTSVQQLIYLSIGAWKKDFQRPKTKLEKEIKTRKLRM